MCGARKHRTRPLRREPIAEGIWLRPRYCFCGVGAGAGAAAGAGGVAGAAGAGSACGAGVGAAAAAGGAGSAAAGGGAGGAGGLGGGTGSAGVLAVCTAMPSSAFLVSPSRQSASRRQLWSSGDFACARQVFLIGSSTKGQLALTAFSARPSNAAHCPGALSAAQMSVIFQVGSACAHAGPTNAMAQSAAAAPPKMRPCIATSLARFCGQHATSCAGAHLH